MSKFMECCLYNYFHTIIFIDTGILQGVSHLLLVYDQGEVRKIIKACQGVIEYIKVRDNLY